MRVALVAVIAATFAVAAASSAPAPRPLLALQFGDGPIDAPSHLVRLDPRTLEPRAGGVRLPSWAFGFAAAWSPAGDAVAVVPKADETTERLYVVDSATLRLRGRVPLQGRDVCVLAWPARRTILALAGEHGGDNGQRSLLALRIDPVAKRIVSRTAVPVDWSVDAVAAVPGGAAAVGRNRLVVFTTRGIRRARLPFASVPAAIASGSRGRIFVAGFDGSVAVLGPDGRVDVHRWRSTSSIEKGNTPTVSAVWLGGDVLAMGAAGSGRGATCRSARGSSIRERGAPTPSTARRSAWRAWASGWSRTVATASASTRAKDGCCAARCGAPICGGSGSGVATHTPPRRRARTSSTSRPDVRPAARTRT